MESSIATIVADATVIATDNNGEDTANQPNNSSNHDEERTNSNKDLSIIDKMKMKYGAKSATNSYQRSLLLFPYATTIHNIIDNDNYYNTEDSLNTTTGSNYVAINHRKKLRYGVDTVDTRTAATTTTAAVVAQYQQQQQQQLVSFNDTSQQQTSLLSSSIRNVSNTHTSGSATTTNTNNGTTTVLTVKQTSQLSTSVPQPKWHAPWTLSTVLSSHLGWVRCIAIDTTTNRLFATGSTDQTIKVWNLPNAVAGNEENSLQYTLTGHISAVRGLVFSERHPYLFSAGEDKTIKCWDLETNQVVRHYHGHLSGIYCLAMHPTLDVLVSAGRDAVARVWDIRTKTQLHVLSGHDHTIASVLTSSVHPQVITGSHDCTIKLWDLVAGKCFTTLTHHQKSIRAMVAAPPALQERTFVSVAADSIRKWQTKNGRFLHKYATNQNGNTKKGVVLNAVAAQDDGVIVTGGDDGSMNFYDYTTGYNFQSEMAKVQPGSIEYAENAIMALSFDMTGTRLITGEADKTIKIWKQNNTTASELTHPIDMKAWRKTYIAQSKERF